MDYGAITLSIEKVIAAKGISKNKICRELDIPRTNFNRYCRNEFQRLDAGLLCKLCYFLEIDIGDLLKYEKPKNRNR